MIVHTEYEYCSGSPAEGVEQTISHEVETIMVGPVSSSNKTETSDDDKVKFNIFQQYNFFYQHFLPTLFLIVHHNL